MFFEFPNSKYLVIHKVSTDVVIYGRVYKKKVTLDVTLYLDTREGP